MKKSDKKKLTRRNPFVALAIKRKAGTHTKLHKYLRGAMNRDIFADS